MAEAIEPSSGHPESVVTTGSIVKARVRIILTEFPETRDDDFWLLIRYYQRFHPELKIYAEYRAIPGIVAPESIRRKRQEVQNDEGDLGPLNPKVAEKRATASNKARCLNAM